MCGFVGIASTEPAADTSWLTIGRETLVHRGPDDAGSWRSRNKQVSLAHRRLSVIDLSDAAHQPMTDDSGRLCIVFNGEIYNYATLRTELASDGTVFHSSSDTEVLLASYRRWGTNCLSKLNGMFAFALYDEERESIFLARDRAGEKPLYLHAANGTLRFASELKALLADPALSRRIDTEALDCYLSMGFVPGDRCLLSGFSKLPPAHALEFDLSTGSTKIWRYWNLPGSINTGVLTAAAEAALMDKLEALLEAAVCYRLTADVPVGILLSGGADSSLITAMAARTSKRLKTFTVRFPGYGRLDETVYARTIARHFNTDHVELEADETIATLLPELARQFDEPVIDSSMIPTYLVTRMVRGHCTVALSGDGGDELFGGYSHYSQLLRSQIHSRAIPLALRTVLSTAAEHYLPVGLKGRNWLQRYGLDFTKGLPYVSPFFDPTTRRKLLAQVAGWPCVAESVFSNRVPQVKELLQRATRMDFENYLAEDILVKVDRSSMLNSLEVRAPMLDHRVIEFAYADIPCQLKATPWEAKILLKKLCSRTLPANFNPKRKQGFSIPLANWLKGGAFRELFHDVLMDRQSLFPHKVVQSLLQGQSRGHSNSERLFGLVLFELWRRQYGITF